eukprot:6463032-Amphidinium_carterae.1
MLRVRKVEFLCGCRETFARASHLAVIAARSCESMSIEVSTCCTSCCWNGLTSVLRRRSSLPTAGMPDRSSRTRYGRRVHVELSDAAFELGMFDDLAIMFLSFNDHQVVKSKLKMLNET